MLHKLAVTALERAWIRRTRIRSCRLVCDRLQRQSPQRPLFPELAEKNHMQENILGAMDSLRTRYGGVVIGVGRQYHQKNPAVAIH